MHTWGVLPAFASGVSFATVLMCMSGMIHRSENSSIRLLAAKPARYSSYQASGEQ